MQIPTPPSDTEKYLYEDQNKIGLYLWGSISFLFLSVGAAIFSYHHSGFWPYLLFVILTSFYLGLSYFIGFFGEKFNPYEHINTVMANQDFLPTVDVLLPSCGEDYRIIRNTLKRVSKLDYPENLLSVYVLDDCKNPAHNLWLEEESERRNFKYISRPNKGELKKAGNMRYAFNITNGDYFLVLDADFVPRPDMLREMVPHMSKGDTAIVQTPQYFEIKLNDPWIQKGAAYIQELFYRLIQVNRQTWNGSICVGTCALYSRKALAPHGGTAAIGYSEDVHTGFQAIVDGWKIKYLPINLSKGVCPDNATAFITQQYRWATGSFTLFLDRHFWSAPIPVMTKLNYLSGMLYYITTALGLFLVPLPSLYMLTYHPADIIYYSAIFSFPSFIFGSIGQALWTKAPWGVYAVQARQLCYWSHVLAIWDKLAGSTVAWVATGDTSASKKSGSIYDRFIILFVTWNLFTLGLSFYLIFIRMQKFHYLNFIPTIFFTSFNSLIFVTTLMGIKSSKKT